MNNEEIIELQKELDTKKYIESELAKRDLSGYMNFCENCAFQKQINETYICNLNRKDIEDNCVCAKNQLRNSKPKKNIRKNK